MTDDERRRVIDALERAVSTCFTEHAYRDFMSDPSHFINQALVIMRGDIPTREPAAWIAHAQFPYVTMDPPVKGGLPRTPLYK